MKNSTLIYTSILLMFFLSGSVAFAQQSKEDKKKEKEEEKKWKKKLKEVEPLQYKSMYEEHSSLKGESSSLKRQIQALEKQTQETKGSVASKDSELSGLQSKYSSMKEDCAKNTSANSSKTDDPTKGIVFKVQVGAYEKKDLSQFKGMNFGVEEVNGVKKYTIANFRQYWEAELFKNYMKAMGVKDAFIVAYQNNTRVDDIKKALSAAGQLDQAKTE